MVLFVCSECSFFVKTGGLADVMACLPQTLSKDISCSVVLPYYKKIKDSTVCELIYETKILFNNEYKYVGILKKKINNVNYYFIDNNEFYYYDELYKDNDDIRFSFFNIAILECINLFGDVSIIHCNDWHSGLIPFLIKYKYHYEIKTIFTIHNIQYQGIFNKEIYKYWNVYNESIILNDNINFMKAGISNADIITTVSNTYRDETLCYLYSYYLEKELLNRIDDYYGILNGIDNTLYNPLTDNHIYQRYNTIEGKHINKNYFIKEFEFNDNMLCSLISRLCDQKGIELILDTIDELINTTSINFFLMGSGEIEYENKFKELHNKYPKRVKIYIGYNESLAQKVYASSDLLLVPSKFEPCGLSQLIAMRYGTLVLVRQTGGLKDTVNAYNENEKTGTGFSFKNFDSFEFKKALYIAYELYYNKPIWNSLIENAMNMDYSFSYSSKKYLELYKKLGG